MRVHKRSCLHIQPSLTRYTEMNYLDLSHAKSSKKKCENSMTNEMEETIPFEHSPITIRLDGQQIQKLLPLFFLFHKVNKVVHK